MAISTAHATGSQTAVIGTEHTLNPTTPETTVGMFQLVVDLSAMQAGDTVELRVKEKAQNAAGTQRTVFTDTYSDAQSADSASYASPALILGNGWDMTLKQTAGTGRAYPWSIRSVT